jgi:hypothetical protein
MHWKSKFLKQGVSVVPEFLYHGTDDSVLPEIIREGLVERSYFTLPVAEWFAKNKAGKTGGAPIVLRIHGTQFIKKDLDLVKRLLPGSLSSAKDVRIWRYLHRVPVTPIDVIRLSEGK